MFRDFSAFKPILMAADTHKSYPYIRVYPRTDMGSCIVTRGAVIIAENHHKSTLLLRTEMPRDWPRFSLLMVVIISTDNNGGYYQHIQLFFFFNRYPLQKKNRCRILTKQRYVLKPIHNISQHHTNYNHHRSITAVNGFFDQEQWVHRWQITSIYIILSCLSVSKKVFVPL